jgi:2-keto-4-pentenoate hydratase
MDQQGFDAEVLADLLAEARRSVRQIADLPSRLIPPGADEAYRVNACVANRLGWEHLGWKIAATTEAVRNKLGTDGPIYGRTFTKFRHHSPVHLKHGELLDPLVECEFFITLGRDLGPREEPWTMSEVINAAAMVHTGIEVAECRFPMHALPPLPAILADGSASGRYVFGGAIEDWRSGLTTRRVGLKLMARKSEPVQGRT